jgi:hypothetical protein
VGEAVFVAGGDSIEGDGEIEDVVGWVSVAAELGDLAVPPQAATDSDTTPATTTLLIMSGRYRRLDISDSAIGPSSAVAGAPSLLHRAVLAWSSLDFSCVSR